MRIKTLILMMIVVFASLYAADTLYSGAEDRSDRLSSDQAGVFSPGYVNATMQKTRAIINQADPQKSLADRLVDYVRNKMANNIMKNSAGKVVPELKRKSGGISKSVSMVEKAVPTTSTVTTTQTGYGGKTTTTTTTIVNPTGATISVAKDTIGYYSPVHQGSFDASIATDTAAARLASLKDNKNMSGIFKAMLSENNFLSENRTGKDSNEISRAIAVNSLKESAMLPYTEKMSPEDSQITSKLTDIIKNPTEDQKMLLDAAKSVMKMAKDSASPELKKASNKFIHTVAAVLVAQAIPDLLKEGDVSNIKSIFAELGTVKDKIMFEYQGSTRPYYDQVVKELSKSMGTLKLKNILSGSITKEELAKIPPNELDKIVEKLRRAKDKSFEEEYILQQEAKYRKAYIDPNKQILDEKMKNMMKDFTKKLSGVLEEVKAQKK